MPELQVHLLGRFQILVDGVPVEESRWGRKKAKVLIKLLALAPGHSLHREQLLELLWPEMETDAALNNLHKVIHAARRALEPTLTSGGSRFLLTQDSVVLLAESLIWIDAIEFERLAGEALRSGDTGSLDATLALYRADLLEEDLYEDWASLHRERLRLLFQRSLERLAGNLEAANDERAIEVFNRLLTIHPANEDAHRRLMKLYAARGQRHFALQQYRLCCEALLRELEAEPEPATVRLYERLLVGVPEVAPFAGEVATAASADLPAAPPVAPPAASKPSRRSLLQLVVPVSIAVAGVTYYRLRDRTPPRDAGPQSLAILPLRIEGATGQAESAADGITEELINSTSRLRGLRVMARGTMFAYKGRTDALTVGRDLKVSTIVSGYLRQTGETATVGLELIDTQDGSRLWARRYSAPAGNLTRLQPLLTAELETALRKTLAGQPGPQPVRSTTEDATSYRLYLTGRSYWNLRTPDGFRKSIDFYKKALDRDPNYALAWAGLADSYGLLGWQSGLPRDHFPKARDAAQKALELDQRLAEAQTTLAMVSALYDWNWVAAEAQFRRAIELNPGYATAHHWYGVHLAAQGRLDEAQRELGTALDLDPLSPVVNLNMGYPAYYRRSYGEALGHFSKALALNAAFAPAHEDQMTVCALDGRPAQAASEALEFLRYSGQQVIAAGVEPAARRGDYAGVLKTWLAMAEKAEAGEYVSPMIPARLAVALGDREKSFAWLERALEQKSPQLVYLAADPRYDELRSDPRFAVLLRRTGLTLK